MLGMPPLDEVELGVGNEGEPDEPDDEGLGKEGMPLLLELEGEELGMEEGMPLEEEGELLGIEGAPLELDDVEEDWHPANTIPPINATNRGCFSLRAWCCMVRTSSWNAGEWTVDVKPTGLAIL